VCVCVLTYIIIYTRGVPTRRPFFPRARNLVITVVVVVVVILFYIRIRKRKRVLKIRGSRRRYHRRAVCRPWKIARQNYRNTYTIIYLCIKYKLASVRYVVYRYIYLYNTAFTASGHIDFCRIYITPSSLFFFIPISTGFLFFPPRECPVHLILLLYGPFSKRFPREKPITLSTPLPSLHCLLLARPPRFSLRIYIFINARRRVGRSRCTVWSVFGEK